MLVRDSFPGKAIVNAVIDLPFALPTIVAGLTLLALYGADSPIGINVAFTQAGVVLALLFVTLPFVVRAVQPVLLELDRDMEEAAASLGAGRFTIFRRIVLPNLLPGDPRRRRARLRPRDRRVRLAGPDLRQHPFKTEVASVYIFSQIERDNVTGAAAVSVVLLGDRARVLLADRDLRPTERCAMAAIGGRFGKLRRCATSRSATWRCCCCPGGDDLLPDLRARARPAWTRSPTPDGAPRLQADPDHGRDRGARSTRSSAIGCALLLVRIELPGQGAAQRAHRPAVRGLAVVVGLSLILVYGTIGWFGRLLTTHGIQVIFAIPGMVLATIFVSLPFVVREVVPVLQEIGTEQEQAARTLGARLADLLADHPAGDPLGRRLRRRAHDRARARRVRRGHASSPAGSPARPRRCRSTSQSSSRTSTTPAPTRASILLALLALATLLVMNLAEAKGDACMGIIGRRTQPSASATSSRSTTSRSTSPTAR